MWARKSGADLAHIDATSRQLDNKAYVEIRSTPVDVPFVRSRVKTPYFGHLELCPKFGEGQ